MITVTKDIKNFFFDRKIVLNRVNAARRKALSASGALVRRNALDLIPERKMGDYSKPGNPPHSHVRARRRRFAAFMKKQGVKIHTTGGFRGVRHILFGYQPERDEVIVGPISNRGGHVTNVLEFGGTARKYSLSRRKLVPYRMRPRPYMAPALKKAEPELPGFWEGSVRA